MKLTTSITITTRNDKGELTQCERFFIDTTQQAVTDYYHEQGVTEPRTIVDYINDTILSSAQYDKII